MTRVQDIDRALVVLSPDLVSPDKPMASALLQRAVALAKATGCELELFHVCFDGTLDGQLFASLADRENSRKAMTDRDATVLSEMATRLGDEGVRIRYEVRWDYPRSDAILRKITESKPDIVMKAAREHAYVLGISSNTDWDLARRSPAHVWLVNDSVESVGRVLAAIGNSFGEPADITKTLDYELLRTAQSVAKALSAETWAVNAYQVPDYPVGAIAGAPPLAAGALAQAAPRDNKAARRHAGTVRAIARYFGIDTDKVEVREGRTAKVIPEVAKSVDADVIVMGASSIGRLERLVSKVTVEPVMAETDADILVVRDGEQEPVSDDARPLSGEPRCDVEQAITDPGATFDSPAQVVNLRELSIELRDRILQAWEHDIRAEMEEEGEGGAVRDIDVNVLDDILAARRLLENRQQHGANGRQLPLHGMGS